MTEGVIEAAAVAVLADHPEGLTLGELHLWLGERGVRVQPFELEALLLLSDRVREVGVQWRRGEVGRAELVLEALQRHADATGRSLFRAETALQTLPLELRPTQDELASIVLQSGRFELLKNNMLRRRG